MFAKLLNDERIRENKVCKSTMSKLISDSQVKLNASLHTNDKNFGARTDGAGTALHLSMALIKLKESGLCQSILDYGTGKGFLVKQLQQELPTDILVRGYDPAILEYKDKPQSPSDIVTCLDVLEHIEMNSIDYVLRDIRALTARICYLVIDLQPAVKKLADGRNAHILLAPPDWWVSRVSQVFPCITAFPVMHRSGLPQKLVIAACLKPKTIPYMYRFVHHLGAHSIIQAGGNLETVVNYNNNNK
ncbi:hypothetical protein [Prochlorococcus marinus]|uniref:hypothetical protein n=1 Tax=Prochlorococcus marinus TaxID=1219 RepID=UPI0012DAAE3A|nr:hypothetical protein [Prochlorococcus marinus]